MDKQNSFEIEYENENGIEIYSLSGDADSTNIDGFFEKIIDNIDGNSKIILILEKTNFCNSKFLGNLFFLADTLEKKGGKICIVGVSPKIIESLSIVGIFDIIPSIQNKTEAYKYLLN